MQKFNRLFLTMILIIFSTQTMALQCYLTLMKSKCWNKHNVTLSVMDIKTESYLFKNLTLNKDHLWLRKKFNCDAGQGLLTKATFTPRIWDLTNENDATNEFPTSRIWYLPIKMKNMTVAWNVPICFPTDFADVPMLPTVDKHCDCQSTIKEMTPLPKPPNLPYKKR